MLKFFRRRTRQTLPAGADPLKIRSLLDDPRLQSVMGGHGAPDATITPLRRIERERRMASQLFQRAA